MFVALIYVCIGVMIVTTAFELLSVQLRKLHFTGQPLKNVGKQKIWFGGRRFVWMFATILFGIWRLGFLYSGVRLHETVSYVGMALVYFHNFVTSRGTNQLALLCTNSLELGKQTVVGKFRILPACG